MPSSKSNTFRDFIFTKNEPDTYGVYFVEYNYNKTEFVILTHNNKTIPPEKRSVYITQKFSFDGVYKFVNK